MLGPKFIYKNNNTFKKSKLAFILPNFKASKRIGPHNSDVISVLVGSLLGQGKAERLKSGGIRFIIQQPIRHKTYLLWLYKFFNDKGYCTNNLPIIYYKNNLTVYKFYTYGFTNFMWIYKLFYNSNKIKVVPDNIYNLLTPLSLAIWVQDNGKWHKKIKKDKGVITIATYCFSLNEVNLLINTLRVKYKLNCNFYFDNGKYYILINKESISNLRELVLPFMVPSMFYKLGL